MRLSFAVFCQLLCLFVALPELGFGQHSQLRSNQANNPWSGYGLQSEAALPWIDAEVGFISLYRKQPDASPFIFAPPSTVLLDMNQLAGDGGAGFDGMLNMKRIFGGSSPVDFQMRFFESRGMTSSQVIESTPQVVPVFYNAIPITPATSYLIDYETDLQSAEMNLRTPILSRLYVVAGLRYLELEERFDILDIPASSSTTRVGFFSSNQNDAFGGQLGLEGVLLSGNAGRITGGIKWAYLSNSVGGIAQASDSSGSPLITNLVDTQSTQLIDIQLGGTFAITDWLGLYGGYQGLIGSDFALATTQSRDSQIVQPTNPVRFESAQWHGYRLGVSLTW